MSNYPPMDDSTLSTALDGEMEWPNLEEYIIAEMISVGHFSIIKVESECEAIEGTYVFDRQVTCALMADLTWRTITDEERNHHVELENDGVVCFAENIDAVTWSMEQMEAKS